MARKFVTDEYGHHSNPAYHPDKCGLELIEYTSNPNCFCSFDNLWLFRDVETGRRYWVADSGCSCPAPLDNVRGLDDMEELDLTRELYEKEKARVMGRVN